MRRLTDPNLKKKIGCGISWLNLTKPLQLFGKSLEKQLFKKYVLNIIHSQIWQYIIFEYYSSFHSCWLRWWVYKIRSKIPLHWIMFIGVILMAFRLIWIICSTWWNQRLEDNVKGSTNKQWSKKTYRSTERRPFRGSGLPFTHLLLI